MFLYIKLTDVYASVFLLPSTTTLLFLYIFKIFYEKGGCDKLIASRFKFYGELLIPKNREKFFKKWNGGSNGKTEMASIGFSVKEGQNIGFVQSFGLKSEMIRTKDTENKNIEVPWEDRFNPDVISMVANYRKYRVNLGDELGGEKDFITEYDMIQYLAEMLPQYSGMVYISGTYEKNTAKDDYPDKFRINSVFAVADTVKPKLTLTFDFFYNKDSVDTASLNDDKKIYVNGYVAQYINKDLGVRYCPQTAVLSAEKYDMDNEKHLKQWNYKKSYLEKLAKNKMYHLLWECRLVNGAEEVEFDESQLTDQQKMQIEFGVRTLEDFKPKGNIYGSVVREVRLFEPILQSGFENGILTCDETIDEFEEKIFVRGATEKLDDILNAAKAKAAKEETTQATVTDSDVDDLF